MMADLRPPERLSGAVLSATGSSVARACATLAEIHDYRLILLSGGRCSETMTDGNPRGWIGCIAEAGNPIGPATWHAGTLAELAQGAYAFAVVTRAPSPAVYQAISSMMEKGISGVVLAEVSTLARDAWIATLSRGQAPILTGLPDRWGSA